MSFDRRAHLYHQAGVEQERIAKQLARYLVRQLRDAHAPDLSRVVEVGAGTGHLTFALLDAMAHWPQWGQKALILNDLAPTMLQNLQASWLRQRRAHWPQPTWLVGNCSHPNIGQAVTQGQTQRPTVWVSSSALQWVQPLVPFITHWVKSILAPGAWCAISTFGPRHFEEFKATTGVGLTYRSHANWISLLQALGCRIAFTHSEVRAVHYESPRAILRQMSQTGVTLRSSTPSTWQLQTKADLQAFEARYRATTKAPHGAVPLTWHALYYVFQTPQTMEGV